MYAIRTRQRLAGLLLVLWGLMCLSNVVFRHSHRLPDGRVITHAHPYIGISKKVPLHKHTQTELAWLDYIGQAPVEIPLVDLRCPLPLQTALVAQPVFVYLFSAHRQMHLRPLLRGPPARIG